VPAAGRTGAAASVEGVELGDLPALKTKCPSLSRGTEISRGEVANMAET
jgi:hypothetical protein